jgi:uncharacterized protein involved in exopolysaccharide biosynthesis
MENPIIDVTATAAQPRTDWRGIVRRRRGWFWTILVCGATLTFAWAWTRPILYQAEARVWLTRLGDRSIPMTDRELASEVELMRGDAQLDRLTKLLEQKPAGSSLHDHEAARVRSIRELRTHLHIEPLGQSTVLALRYQHASARIAAEVANQVANAYVASGASPAVARPVAAEAADAEQKLAAFDERNRGAQLDAEVGQRLQNLIQLEIRIAQLRGELQADEDSLVWLRQRAQSLPERAVNRKSSGPNLPLLAQLRAEMAVLENRRRDVAPGSPDALAIEAQLQNWQRLLSQESATSLTQQEEGPHPQRQRLDWEIARLESRAVANRAQLTVTQNELLRVRALADRLHGLQRARRELVDQVNQVKAVRSDAGEASPDTFRKILLSPAAIPVDPMPRPLLAGIAIGLAVTLAAALLFCWLLDRWDRPIQTPGDFSQASGLPPYGRFAKGAGA